MLVKDMLHFWETLAGAFVVSLPMHPETNRTKFSQLWVQAQLCLIKQNIFQKRLLELNRLVYVTLMLEAKHTSWSNFYMLVCFFAKIV